MVQSVSSSQSRYQVGTGEDPNALKAAQFGVVAKRLENMTPASRTETLASIEQRDPLLAKDLRDYLAKSPAARQEALQRMAKGLPASDDADGDKDTAPDDPQAALREQGMKMIDDMRQQDSSALLSMLDSINNPLNSFWNADTSATDPMAALGGAGAGATDPTATLAGAGTSAADITAALAGAGDTGLGQLGNLGTASTDWWSNSATGAYSSNISPKDAFLAAK